MIIAYGEANKARWTLDAQDNFRTLDITNGKPYEIGNKLLYSILTEILTVIADTDEIEDAVNEIMIALL